MKKSIRATYPFTASMLGHSLAAVSVQVSSPPDYTSKNGRVKRWKANPMGERLWCIYGRTIHATVRRLEFIPESHKSLIQCFGTRHQMDEVQRLALTRWSELPGGSEFRAMFDRAYPTEVKLEVTPLITRPAKPRKRKPAQPNP